MCCKIACRKVVGKIVKRCDNRVVEEIGPGYGAGRIECGIEVDSNKDCEGSGKNHRNERERSIDCQLAYPGRLRLSYFL